MDVGCPVFDVPSNVFLPLLLLLAYILKVPPVSGGERVEGGVLPGRTRSTSR